MVVGVEREEEEEEESEPMLVVGLGRGSEWDKDLGRVRLGYDMVRIRVRYEGDEEMLRRCGRLSHLFFRSTFEGSYRVCATEIKGEKGSVCSANFEKRFGALAIGQFESTPLRPSVSSFVSLPWFQLAYFVATSPFF